MAIPSLVQLRIVRAIFHSVPSRNRFTPNEELILCDIETSLDVQHQKHLKTRLIRVINSSRAYPIDFAPVTDSEVPGEVRRFTTKPMGKAFVPMSQAIARSLHARQHGAISGGLLCVLHVEQGDWHGVVLMKLEREQGAQLQLSGEPGKKTYDMSVLDDLVLTDGTRLFKTALFLRNGEEDDDFDAVVCDDQNKPGSDDMAKFWMKFVGGQVLVEPRVATQRFYNAALSFINDVVEDPVQKQEIYEHLHSQMKAPARQFVPNTFLEDYIPRSLRSRFKQHMELEKVPLSTFRKDTSEIDSRLQRAQYRTKKGAVVSVPVAQRDIVTVNENDIVIADQLQTVDNR